MNLENTKRYTLYIGLKDKDTKKQEIPTDKVKNIVKKVCGDCSIFEGNGYYTHDDGTEVTEPTLKVELLFKDNEVVINFAKLLKAELNQESIGYSEELIKTTLI